MPFMNKWGCYLVTQLGLFAEYIGVSICHFSNFLSIICCTSFCGSAIEPNNPQKIYPLVAHKSQNDIVEADPNAHEGEEGQENPPSKVVLISVCDITAPLCTTASASGAASASDDDADAATAEGEEPRVDEATGTTIRDDRLTFWHAISPLLRDKWTYEWNNRMFWGRETNRKFMKHAPPSPPPHRGGYDRVRA